MVLQAHPRTAAWYSPEEYLERERTAEFKSEYRNGEIIAMAGASFRHTQITSNIVTVLNAQIGDRPCTAVSSDLRVRINALHTYFVYPDVVAFCGEPRFDDSQKDTLLNPSVLIEVLSPSTESYDRGDKAVFYRRIVSLTDYIFVDQSRIYVEHHARQNAFQWLLTEHENLEDEIALPSLQCVLRLSDIYRKVRLDETNSAESA